jgi:ribosomal protein L44E
MVKFPKTMRRYNPVLRKHVVVKVIIAKKRTAGQASPMSKMSKTRTMYGHGRGNLGRYGSKPAASKFKMGNKKRSKKVDIRYEDPVTKKQFTRRHSFRAKKLELV